jgi:methionine-rich copper-binding protein CopC
MKLISIMLCLSACAFSLEPTDSSELTTPTVLSSIPADGATGVALGQAISVTFSEEMDPATLTAATFTLIDETNLVPIAGTVLYADSTVVFMPAADLVRGAHYRATISTDANSGSGVALADTYAWIIRLSPGGHETVTAEPAMREPCWIGSMSGWSRRAEPASWTVATPAAPSPAITSGAARRILLTMTPPPMSQPNSVATCGYIRW